MLERLQSHLVADWRDCLKWSSMRLHVAAILISAMYQAMPVLDPSIAAMLPAPLAAKAVGIYAIGNAILRMTKLGRDAQ